MVMRDDGDVDSRFNVDVVLGGGPLWGSGSASYFFLASSCFLIHFCSGAVTRENFVPLE